MSFTAFAIGRHPQSRFCKCQLDHARTWALIVTVPSNLRGSSCGRVTIIRGKLRTDGYQTVSFS